MLSKELHDLEINLLVSRTVLDTRPITVKYAITEYGSSVLPVTESLVIWGLNHREKIKA
ncbi:winged helix-turn-helix transcriptional regulator [Pedobacter panaciterrae]